jgi:xylan 1,4-beta-xylosidase
LWTTRRGRENHKVIQLDHNVPSWPLHEQPIPVPERGDVWLRVAWMLVWSTATATSFDGETWHTVPVSMRRGSCRTTTSAGAASSPAFVWLHCEDISGDGCHADFDYFTYELSLRPVAQRA